MSPAILGRAFCAGFDPCLFDFDTTVGLNGATWVTNGWKVKVSVGQKTPKVQFQLKPHRGCPKAMATSQYERQI